MAELDQTTVAPLLSKTAGDAAVTTSTHSVVKLYHTVWPTPFIISSIILVRPYYGRI